MTLTRLSPVCRRTGLKNFSGQFLFAEAVPSYKSWMVRRYATLLIFALWMGGFTFYALIVIPTGGKVLDGGELDVGFITQQITNWLNWIGVAALAVLGWNARAESRGLLKLLLAACWLAMAVTLVALFCLHPVLDRMPSMPPRRHQIRGGAIFFNWHRALHGGGQFAMAGGAGIHVVGAHNLAAHRRA